MSRGPFPPVAVGVAQRLDQLDGLAPAALCVAFLVALILIVSRLPSALLHPQFYAEDAWYFYSQAYNLHWTASLFIPEAGYMQELPRLVAGVALLFPVRFGPFVFNLAGAMLQTLPVVALLAPRTRTWGPLSVRVAMATMYVILPNGAEVNIVLTNAMWHLAVLQTLIACAEPPATWRGRLADVLLFSIGALSGPFCLMLLPIVLVYWWFRRQRWTLVIAALMSVGGAIQVHYILTSQRVDPGALGASAKELLRIIAGNIFFNSLIGGRGPTLPIPLLLLIAVGGFVILIRGLRAAPLPVRLYTLFASMVLAAGLRSPLTAAAPPQWPRLEGWPSCRYWYFPCLAFLWAIVWCIAQRESKLMRYASLAVSCGLLVGSTYFWVTPRWKPDYFPRDVARFEQAKPGEHVIFSIYPFGTMDLIKR